MVTVRTDGETGRKQSSKDRLLALLRRNSRLAAISPLVLLLANLTGCQRMCYAPATFHPSVMSRRQRLELLEDAVRRGEVPPGSAQSARRYVEEAAETRLW